MCPAVMSFDLHPDTLVAGKPVWLINSLADDLEEALEGAELPAKSVEGKNASEWILLDFGDLIVNLFTPEMREKYNIDWAVKKFISEGVPASKIVVGLPFYSRGWNNVSGGLDFDGDGVGDGMFGTGGSTLSGKWGVGGQSPYFAVKALEAKYRRRFSVESH